MTDPNPQPAEVVTGTTAGGTGSQALADVISAAVAAMTSVQQSLETVVNRLNTLTTRAIGINEDTNTEINDVGTGDPQDRAERMRNSRDRNDFYRDALQAETVDFTAMMHALTARFLRSMDSREGDRYSASDPQPPASKRL